MPSSVWRCGLTRSSAPAKPARRRLRSTTAPTEPGAIRRADQRDRARLEKLVEIADGHRGSTPVKGGDLPMNFRTELPDKATDTALVG